MIEKKISVNNLEINYKVLGEGIPLLILHGWGASSDSWMEVQEKLAKEGYRVICPDFPGFGKSQNPPSPWSVGDYANWTLGFVDSLGLDNFILLSHSFGGRVAIKFSVFHPDKIIKLILCGSAGLKLKPGVKAGMTRMLAESGNVVFNFWFLRIFKNLFRNIFYLFIRRNDYVKAEGVMRETMIKVIEEDLLSFLSQIKSKTLLVWGEDDKMVPLKCAKIFNKNIKDSRLAVFSGVGHGPHFEVPNKLVEAVINFIK